jgi:hypothetical protein
MGKDEKKFLMVIAFQYSAGLVLREKLKQRPDSSLVLAAAVLIYVAGGIAFFAGLLPGGSGFRNAVYSAWLFGIFGIAAYLMLAVSLGISIILRAARVSPGPVTFFFLLIPPLVHPSGAAAILEFFFSPVYGLFFRSGSVPGPFLSLFAGDGSLWILALSVYLWRTLPLMILIALQIPVSGTIPRKACWTERVRRLSVASLLRTAALSLSAALLLFAQNAAAVLRLDFRYPFSAESDGIALFREALVPGSHYYVLIPILVITGILITGLWYGQKNSHS